MSGFVDIKARVLDYLKRLDRAAPGDETAQVCAAALKDDHSYAGVHPFNELSGAKVLADTVHSPMKAALGPWQRRLDMVIAGTHHCKGDGPVRIVICRFFHASHK